MRRRKVDPKKLDDLIAAAGVDGEVADALRTANESASRPGLRSRGDGASSQQLEVDSAF